MMLSVRRLSSRHKMMMSLLLVITTCCCARSAQHHRPEAPLALLVIERWPEEGVPVLAWKSASDSLLCYPQPGGTKPSGRLPVQPDQQLPWDRSVILVQKTGVLRIREDCDLTASVYESLQNGILSGGSAQRFHFPAGTLLDVVCYAAEGDYIFSYQGQYLEMTGSDSRQEMLRPPQTQWWVRLTEDGRSIGWVPVDGDKVSVADRKF